jgi:hypothetical protein
MEHNACFVCSKTFDPDWFVAVLCQGFSALGIKLNQDWLIKLVFNRKLFACCRSDKDVAKLQFLFLHLNLFELI